MKSIIVPVAVLGCVVLAGCAFLRFALPVEAGASLSSGGGATPAGESGPAEVPGEEEAGRSVHVVPVDIAALPSGGCVELGRYPLAEGDVVRYRISAAGKGFLSVGFVPAGLDPSDPSAPTYFAGSVYAGAIVLEDEQRRVSADLAGDYILYVRNFSKGDLRDVAGSVEIASYSNAKK